MQFKMVLSIVCLVAGLSGCVVISPLPANAVVEVQEPPVQTFAHKLNPDGQQPPVDFSRLQPGSYCKLETASAEIAFTTAADARSELPTQRKTVAGRIVSMDETHIVLADAISISSRPGKVTGVPVTTKVMAYAVYGPMAPRLFKNTGVGRETIAIPGELTIDRASVRDLQPVDGANWSYFQTGGQWFERIGIDFDFNIEPAAAG